VPALIPVTDFGKSCDKIESVSVAAFKEGSSTRPSTRLFIGITNTGALMSTFASSASRILAQNANSFTFASNMAIYTTTAHVAHFVPLISLLGQDSAEPVKSEMRRVERGARIVTAVSSNMSLVLQMPRGNLETANPRPMVMSVVEADIDA
jgi:elongator complex protein 1